MIYNYTKCESVIAKIMADLDSTEVRQRTSDIKEWIFEAVDKIGAPMQYISKESGADDVPVFQIQDNQIPIPVDLVVLDGVAFSERPTGPWKPMKKTTALFKEPKRIHHHEGNIYVTPEHDPANKAIEDTVEFVPEHQPIGRKMITSQSQFYDIRATKYLNTMFGHSKKDKEPEYFIKPGWIVTNRPKGFIKLAYKAVATDERGYPLIPDLTSYQEAIYWYVNMKLMYPKLVKGTLGGKGVNTGFALYNDARNSWNFYRNQAYAEAMMPTADDMQNIKNDWHKLIPDWDASDSFFKDINKEQTVYTDYYYGY